jgi:predicted DNA binding CopG/RHH family protein
MVGRSKDPKGARITVRISDNDLDKLQAEARKRSCTVGAVIRHLIRDCIPTPTTKSST